LHGNTSSDAYDVWKDLDDDLKRTFTRQDGKSLKLSAACIDAGDGNRTKYIREFCAPRWSRKIYPIKGYSGFQREVFAVSKGKNAKFKGALVLVGSDNTKLIVHSAIKNDQFRYSISLDASFYDQLLGERLQTKMVRGREVREWVVVPGVRNEALDCTGYAIAAKYSLGRINWEAFKSRIAEQDNKQEEADLSAIFQSMHN